MATQKERIQNHVTSHVMYSDNELVNELVMLIMSVMNNTDGILYTVDDIHNKHKHATNTMSTQPLLIGCLTYGYYGNLMIKDNTGTVSCSLQDLSISDIENYIILQNWNYISSKYHSYIEIIEYKCLKRHNISSLSHDVITISQHIDSMSSRNRKHVINIQGRVSAISTPTSNHGNGYYLLIKMRCDNDSMIFYHLVVMSTHLLFLSRYLKINENYIFTNMRDSVLNKWKHNEYRVLATTSLSSVMNEIYIRQKRSIDCLSSDTCPYIHENVVSYQGEITDVLVPEAGLYELDHTVRLYMCDVTHAYQGEGLRVGVIISLSNVHVLNISNSKWKSLSGFYCCCLSSVTINKFSTTSSPYKPFLMRNNKLLKLIHPFEPPDIAWILQVYLILQERLKINGTTLLQMLHTIISLVGIVPSSIDKDDVVSCFFSSPHCCPATSFISSSNWPSLPALKYFSEHHHGNKQQQTDLSSHAEWNYTETTMKNFLIGQLKGDDNNGYLQLCDVNDAVNIVSTSENSLFIHCGSHVIISDMTVITEEMSVYNKGHRSSQFITYIHPITYNIVNTDIPSAINNSLYFIVTLKSSVLTSSFKHRQIKVLASYDINSLTRCTPSSHVTREHPSSPSSHVTREHPSSPTRVQSSLECVQCVLQFENTSFYCYLQYGGLYSLTPYAIETKLLKSNPSITITNNHVIDLLEVSEKWNIIEYSDISDIMSKLYYSSTTLPRYNFSQHLVSFKGCIVTHTLRLAPTISTDSSANNYTLAIEVRSISTPDTITAYIYLNNTPLPIALLPGAQVMFYNFMLKCSRSNNPYCVHCASSSIEILQLPHQSCKDPILNTSSLPVTLISNLLQKLTSGQLSRNIVCVRVSIVSIQYLKIQFLCLTCGSNIIDHHCHISCGYQRSTLKAEASAIVTDGSGYSTIYCDSMLVGDLLKCKPQEWDQMLSYVNKQGSVIYYRNMEPETEAQEWISRFVTRNEIHSPIKIYCQPFVSQNQTEERYKNMKIKFQKYTVKLLPKLQLRTINILQSIDYIQEAKSILSDLCVQ